VGPDRHFRLISSHAVGAAPAPGALLRAAYLLAIAALAVGLVLLPFRFCLSAALFHIPCPGCGMTRAALALLRGDVAGALRFQPLSIFVAPVGAVLALERGAIYFWTGRSLERWSRWKETLVLALGAMLIVVWVLRFLGWFGGPVAI
jgi:hypothetical protein